MHKVHGYMIVLHVSILDREKKTPEHRRGHKTNCEKPNALPLVLDACSFESSRVKSARKHAFHEKFAIRYLNKT